MEHELNLRRQKQGLNNSEVTFRLRDIDEKLAKLGGRLEVKTLEDFNKIQAGAKDEISTDSGFSDDDDMTPGGKTKSVAGRSRLNRTMTGAKSTKSLKSRRSATSRRSRSSYRSGGSSHGSDVEKRDHPYDKFFGKKINTALQKKNIVKLTLNDFKQLDFEPIFPGIIHDLIEYLTGYSIREYIRIKEEKE